jgi:hypothetical protein
MGLAWLTSGAPGLAACALAASACAAGVVAAIVACQTVLPKFGTAALLATIWLRMAPPLAAALWLRLAEVPGISGAAFAACVVVFYLAGLAVDTVSAARLAGASIAAANRM